MHHCINHLGQNHHIFTFYDCEYVNKYVIKIFYFQENDCFFHSIKLAHRV